MTKRRRLGLIVVLAVVALGVLSLAVPRPDRPVVINGTAVPPVPALSADRVAQGKALYAQYCASCHGTNLEGVANWKKMLPDGSLPPPPHDSSGHTWHHADALLVSIIMSGGDPAFNSRMPSFKAQLTEEQARLILDFLKSTWDQEKREFQWWVTATNDGS